MVMNTPGSISSPSSISSRTSQARAGRCGVRRGRGRGEGTGRRDSVPGVPTSGVPASGGVRGPPPPWGSPRRLASSTGSRRRRGDWRRRTGGTGATTTGGRLVPVAAARRRRACPSSSPPRRGGGGRRNDVRPKPAVRTGGPRFRRVAALSQPQRRAQRYHLHAKRVALSRDARGISRARAAAARGVGVGEGRVAPISSTRFQSGAASATPATLTSDEALSVSETTADFSAAGARAPARGSLARFGRARGRAGDARQRLRRRGLFGPTRGDHRRRLQTVADVDRRTFAESHPASRGRVEPSRQARASFGDARLLAISRGARRDDARGGVRAARHAPHLAADSLGGSREGLVQGVAVPQRRACPSPTCTRPRRRGLDRRQPQRRPRPPRGAPRSR